MEYINLLKKYDTIEKYFSKDIEEPFELWNASRMRNYHEESIKEILTHAYRNNEFYKDKFDKHGVKIEDFQKLEDLSKFPFTYKEELRGKPWVLLSVPKSELTQVHVSTGTTSKKLGDHIYTLYSWDDIYLNELAIEMPLMVHSLKEDIVVNSLPYEMSSAGMAFHRSFQHGSGAAVVNVGKGGFYSDPKKTLIILKDIEATVFLTTPPYALYLSELAEEMGIDIKKDLK